MPYAKIPALIWSDSLKIGHPLIDDKHEIMVTLYMDLLAAYRRKADREDLIDMITFFFTYVQVHFLDEEKIMRALNYPKYQQHKEIHTALIDELHNGIMTGLKTRGAQLLTPSDFNFIQKWFLIHLKSYDFELGIFLRGLQPIPNSEIIE